MNSWMVFRKNYWRNPRLGKTPKRVRDGLQQKLLEESKNENMDEFQKKLLERFEIENLEEFLDEAQKDARTRSNSLKKFRRNH